MLAARIAARRLLSTSAAVPTGAVISQAANRDKPWSRSQAVKQEAMTGPRFEQTNMALQPNPVAAIDLIAAVPVKMVAGRKATCDGGGGALGHPKVYINLDDGEAVGCGYCGLKFQKDPHAHGHH
ncbi:zinc-finger domain-containing protein [Chytriomyces sp. MP71]|nr:zinc-finger domain-containing protein [Chytriomyces sp. MP71]